MKTFKILVAVVAVSASLAACGEGSDSEGGSNGAGATPTPTSGPVSPTAGLWDYYEFAPSQNTCNREEVVSNGQGGYLLANNAAGFTITPGDGGDVFQCSLSGAYFNCPSRWHSEESVEGYDATLSVNISVAGSYSDNDHMAGAQTAAVSCAGTDCPLAEQYLGAQFPCSFLVDFESEHE